MHKLFIEILHLEMLGNDLILDYDDMKAQVKNWVAKVTAYIATIQH